MATSPGVLGEITAKFAWYSILYFIYLLLFGTHSKGMTRLRWVAEEYCKSLIFVVVVVAVAIFFGLSDIGLGLVIVAAIVGIIAFQRLMRKKKLLFPGWLSAFFLIIGGTVLACVILGTSLLILDIIFDDILTSLITLLGLTVLSVLVWFIFKSTKR